MRLIVQRVCRAAVYIDNKETACIGTGALILVGVGQSDSTGDVDYLAHKVSKLRIFDDVQGKLNEDIWSPLVQGTFLIVSQFTLYGDCGKGNRPSYVRAAKPELGRIRYEQFIARLESLGHETKSGRFGANMQVELVNDGPVTLILESEGRSSVSSEPEGEHTVSNDS